MKFNYDGHGINFATPGPHLGERIVTFAKHPESDGGGYILEREEMDRLGRLFATAPEMLNMLREFCACAVNMGNGEVFIKVEQKLVATCRALTDDLQ